MKRSRSFNEQILELGAAIQFVELTNVGWCYKTHSLNCNRPIKEITFTLYKSNNRQELPEITIRLHGSLIDIMIPVPKNADLVCRETSWRVAEEPGHIWMRLDRDKFLFFRDDDFRLIIITAVKEFNAIAHLLEY